ncbi:hypothetical protein [Segatella copri]|uniref:hypothetical protein n=1 Tax=Segatella copri TaxID=165179 RepID=UPI0022E400E1|nr:hypothetical protein [Segatella copri]
MKKMNEYERHAYLYSAWTALLVPYFLTALIVKSQFPQLINTVMLIGSTFASIAIIYAAIGFYIREVFRSTSKFLFQFPLFKEDETKMPTTEFLLWRNKILSHEQITKVHSIMLEKYGYAMLDEEHEATDEHEARLNIIGAVGIMRKATRGDKILLQCNYRYGFQRNMLGGVVWSFLAIFLFMIISSINSLPFVCPCLIGLILILAQGIFAFVSMKYTARNYARTLINTFVSQNSK